MTHDGDLISEYVSTGTPGLDTVLNGGFLRGRLYLLQGSPGAGKTTIALKYLLECRARGERSLYITLSETADDLQSVAKSHGWDLAGVGVCDLSTTEDSLRADAQYTVFHPSDVELGETTQAILREVEAMQPTSVVFDGLSEVRLLARDPLRYRRQLLALKQYFAEKRITVLLLDDRSTPLVDVQPESIVSGIICLEQQTPVYGGARRRICVSKVRGASFLGGYHDFDIQNGGAVVFPRLAPAAHNPTPVMTGPPIASGVAGLDAMLCGGLDRGTTTLVIGPAGVGKSTVALQYVAAALGNGERAAVYTFDEVLPTLFDRAIKLCPDFYRFAESGQVHVSQIDPAELTPGAFADSVRQAVERDGVKVVVIDSLNGYTSSMPEESFLSTHLHELFAYLNQHGVVTLLVVAQHGAVGPADSPIDISYLADTVLLMRYFEVRAEICQAIGVFKKRTGPHERTLRELSISESGIHVGDPLTRFWGIMTGVPQYGDPGGQAPSRPQIGERA